MELFDGANGRIYKMNTQEAIRRLTGLIEFMDTGVYIKEALTHAIEYMKRCAPDNDRLRNEYIHGEQDTAERLALMFEHYGYERAAQDIRIEASKWPEPPQYTRGQWMPIDSAPLDGTTIIIFDSYSDDKGIDGYGVCTARWDYSLKWWIMHQRYSNVISLINPTHWMPLPEPPQERKD